MALAAVPRTGVDGGLDLAELLYDQQAAKLINTPVQVVAFSDEEGVRWGGGGGWGGALWWGWGRVRCGGGLRRRVRAAACWRAVAWRAAARSRSQPAGVLPQGAQPASH